MTAKVRHVARLALWLFATALSLSATSPVRADQLTIYGKTYGEWSVKWAQWAFAGAKGENAVEDLTGQFCTSHQSDGKVWFLAGSFGTTGVVRNCTIPPNRALFYPVIGGGGWIDCPPPSTDKDIPDADVKKFVAEGLSGDGVSLVTSTLDGIPITSLQLPIVRAQSPKFSTILPVNHVLGDPGCGFTPPAIYPAGRTGRQIIEGYWVMLPPLTPGSHVLNFHGASAPYNFDNEITYNLTVLKAN